MNDGYKDKFEGAVDKAKGKAKEKYGEATDDFAKKMEGKYDQAKGSLKDKAGEAKNKSDND